MTKEDKSNELTPLESAVNEILIDPRGRKFLKDIKEHSEPSKKTKERFDNIDKRFNRLIALTLSITNRSSTSTTSASTSTNGAISS